MGAFFLAAFAKAELCSVSSHAARIQSVVRTKDHTSPNDDSGGSDGDSD